MQQTKTTGCCAWLGQVRAACSSAWLQTWERHREAQDKGPPSSFLLPVEQQSPGYGDLRTLPLEGRMQPFTLPLPDGAVGEVPEGLCKVSPCFPLVLSSQGWGAVAWTEAEDEGAQTKSYGFCWNESPQRIFFSFHLV